MNIRCKIKTTLLSVALLMVGMSSAAFAADNTLKNVSVNSLPGNRVQLVVEMENAAREPTAFAIENPARLALDFPNTTSGISGRERTIGVGAARSYNAVEAGGRTRLIVNLSEMVPYKTRVDGNTVYVTLESGAGVAGAAGDAEHRITNVDFRRGEQGEGRVLITLSDPSVPVDMRQQGDRVVVDFLNTALPRNLENRLDVIDFATPVQTIDAMSRGNGARVVVNPTGDFDYVAYQSGNVYTIEVKPIAPEVKAELQRQRIGYTGERVTLNFQNIEVRSVLQLLADFTGQNIVVSDTVSGNVTLRLNNVPWDQALDIILKTKGLAKREMGNDVILVAPSEEIAAREKLELEAQKQIEELAPLRTEWFQINYAKASDIAELMKGKENSLLSPRGNITIDERTNTLMIQDTAANLDDIRGLVARLDIPVRQVLIESRVVIASDEFTRDLGAKFGFSRNTSAGSNENVIVGGLLDNGVEYRPITAYQIGDDGPEGLMVDLGLADPAGSLAVAVGNIGSRLLHLELQAMQQEDRGEIISSPRVVTSNQKEAVIEQGVEIPYQEASSSGATTVSFKKAVLSLKVTPQITPDDRVILDLGVNKDSVGRVFAGIPSVDTREVNTQVLVDNGDTVVLGGIYEQAKVYSEEKVPLLGDIPLLGYLFRSTSNQDDRSELLIFVTPKILKEQLKAASN